MPEVHPAGKASAVRLLGCAPCWASALTLLAPDHCKAHVHICVPRGSSQASIAQLCKAYCRAVLAGHLFTVQGPCRPVAMPHQCVSWWTLALWPPAGPQCLLAA